MAMKGYNDPGATLCSRLSEMPPSFYSGQAQRLSDTDKNWLGRSDICSSNRAFSRGCEETRLGEVYTYLTRFIEFLNLNYGKRKGEDW